MATETVETQSVPPGAPPAGAPPAAAPPAAAPPEAKRPMPPERRRLLIGLGAVAALIAVIFGLRYLVFAFTHETTDDAKIDTDQVTITSKISERVARILVDTNQPVKKGQLLIELDNRDERTRLAQAEATLRAAQEQARASQENVAYVKAQQDAQNLQNEGAIRQASATIAGASDSARSQGRQIDVAQAGVAVAQAQLRSAQAGVPAAQEGLRNAQAVLRRAQSLVATGDAPQSQLDSARATYASAESALAQAQAAVESAQADVLSAQQRLDAQRATTGSSQAQIGVAEATLETARGKLAESSTPTRITTQQANADALRAQAAQADAQAQTARDQLSYTEIHSPVEGYVGEKYVEVGQTVAPGTALMAIIPANDVYVTANFKETQLGSIHPGQDVEMTIDAYPGVNFAGKVQTIAPASQNTFSLVPAQNATGNFVKVTQRVAVRVVFTDPDPKYPLRPGMSVVASVKTR
jgi:membrane fusion protein (multidrug efflux system)